MSTSIISVEFCSTPTNSSPASSTSKHGGAWPLATQFPWNFGEARATFKMILKEYFVDNAQLISLQSVDDIFRTWNQLHLKLKEKYFLMPEEDKEDAIESSRMDVLIANPYGIFGVSGHRTVQEFSRFYAYGSGSDYALGSMWTTYDSQDISAETIARKSIEAAAEFDDGTGLPVDSFTIKTR